MVSAVSGPSAVVPTSSAPVSPFPAADKTINMLLKSSDILQSLASHSSSYLPPTIAQVMSTLWGGINVNSSSSITEADVQKFVVSEGGNSSDAHALWVVLDPPDKNGKTASTVNAADFAFSPYLSQAISSSLASIQASVLQLQQQAGPASSDNFLGAFSAFGGSSDVGSGIGFFINVFV